MVERPEFEFPMPAPGHNSYVLETSKTRLKRLVNKELAGEPEAVRRAGGKIADSLLCLDLGLGDPAYNKARALREAGKILFQAQMGDELPRVSQLTKKAYDTAAREIAYQSSPLAKILNQSKELKKERKEKEVPDEMRSNIPYGTDLNKLYKSAQKVLLNNHVLRRQLGDELYSKFSEAVLALFRGETLSRSQLVAQGLKPELVYNQFKSIKGNFDIKRSEFRRGRR